MEAQDTDSVLTDQIIEPLERTARRSSLHVEFTDAVLKTLPESTANIFIKNTAALENAINNPEFVPTESELSRIQSLLTPRNIALLDLSLPKKRKILQRFEHFDPNPLSTSAKLKLSLQILAARSSYNLKLVWNTISTPFSGEAIEDSYGYAVSGYFLLIRKAVLINVMLLFCIGLFLALPEMVETGFNINFANSSFFDICITGNIFFGSEVFYSGYQPNSGAWPMNVLYPLITVIVCFLSALIMTFYFLYRSEQKSIRIKAQWSLTRTLLSSWNFNLNTKKGVNLAVKQFNEDIKSFKEGFSVRKTTVQDRVIHVSTNVIVCLLLGGSFALVYFDEVILSGIFSSIMYYHVSGFVVTANLVFSTLIYIVSSFEQYQSTGLRTSLGIIRYTLLFLGNFAVYLFILFSTNFDTLREIHGCWEEVLGSSLYSLLSFSILGTVLIVASFPGIPAFLNAIFGKKLSRSRAKVDFPVCLRLAWIIYLETLVLMGLYVFPLSFVTTSVLLVLMFIVDSFTMRVCEPTPSGTPNRASTSLAEALLLLGVLGAGVFNGALSMVPKSSPNCGPLQEQNFLVLLTTGISKVIAVVPFVGWLVDLIVQPAILLYCTLVMSLILFFSITYFSAAKSNADQLEKQLRLLQRDVAFSRTQVLQLFDR